MVSQQTHSATVAVLGRCPRNRPPLAAPRLVLWPALAPHQRICLFPPPLCSLTLQSHPAGRHPLPLPLTWTLSPGLGQRLHACHADALPSPALSGCPSKQLCYCNLVHGHAACPPLSSGQPVACPPLSSGQPVTCPVLPLSLRLSCQPPVVPGGQVPAPRPGRRPGSPPHGCS